MSKHLLLFFFCCLVARLNAQVLIEEGFENSGLPAGWSVETNATDGGWVVGTPVQVSSQFFNVTSNGSTRVIASNDDGCNCDKSNDLLISPAFDLSGLDEAIVTFDLFFGAQSYQGVTESGEVLISNDGVNWQLLDELHGHGSWDQHILSLNDYAGDTSVYIGFRYNDNGGWLYGIAIDNFSVSVPNALDANLVELKGRAFGEENEPLPVKGTFFNNGSTTIDEIELSYTINGGSPVTETYSGLSAAPFQYFSIDLLGTWVPDAAGTYAVDVQVTLVNGEADADPGNNSGSFDTEIFAKVVAPNKIGEFLAAPPVFAEISAPAGNLDKPTDLTFFPILGKNELWVLNQRNESSGGSTLTINDATTDSPEFWHRVDGNAWHFMSLPTGIDFSSDNFNFATSPGIKDANHSGGSFTGPTLWSSDPDIYAQPSGGNGSHLDMLHGSPFSMGIAHEVDNVFWVYDDWNGDLVRYDFANDHGPGNDDHSDAIVRRFRNIGISADGDIPNHMKLDKATGWLYFVDNGNDRVMRLDINSGTFGGNLPLINEELAEHSEIINFTVETVVSEGLDQACGLEILDNRLLIGDYATGEIIVYDMDNNFAELGRIQTEDGAGLTGITIGPDGNIWYVNRNTQKLKRVEPGSPNSAEEDFLAAQIVVSPNPTKGLLYVTLPELPLNSTTTIRVTDLAGKAVFQSTGFIDSSVIDLGEVPAGLYLVNFKNERFTATRKIVVE
ncbi:MAG: hypothetical protein Kow0027_01560 [Saprospiraceae bacterium]